ncbi:MAG: hypothetical protein RL033_8011 [Pseudomonadota bacterium]
MPELLSVHGRCPRCSQVLIIPAGQLQNVFRCARCQYRAAASALVEEARTSPPRLSSQQGPLGAFDEDTDDQHTRVLLPGGPDEESERPLEALLVPDGSTTSRPPPPPPPAPVLRRFDQSDSEQTRLHIAGSFDAQPHGAQPHGAQPHGAQPYGAQPYGAQPLDAQRAVARPSARPAPMRSGPGTGRASRDATLLGVAVPPLVGVPFPPAPAPLTRCGRDDSDAEDQATRLHLPDDPPPAPVFRPGLRDQTLIGVAPSLAESAAPPLQRFDRVTEDAEDQHTRLLLPMAYEDAGYEARGASPAGSSPSASASYPAAVSPGAVPALPVLRSPVAPRPVSEPELPLSSSQRFGRFTLQLSRSLDDWLQDRRTALLLTLASLSALVGPGLDALLGGPRHGPTVIVSNLVLFFLWTLSFAWLGKLRNELGLWDPSLAWSRFWTAFRLIAQDLQKFSQVPVALRYRTLGELAGALGMAALAMASAFTISQLVWGWPGTGGGLLTGRVWGGALLAISVIALRRAESVPLGFVTPQEITAPVVAYFPAVLDLSIPLNLPSPSGMTPLHQVLEVLAEWEPREWPNQDSYITALERHFLRRMSGAHVERDRRLGTDRAEGTAHFLINESLLIEVIRGFDADTAELLDTRMRSLARVWRGKPALIVAFDAHRSAMFAGAGTPKLEALHQAYPMLAVRMPSARMSLI